MKKNHSPSPEYPVRRFFRTKVVGAYGLSPDGSEAVVVTNLTGVPDLWRTRPEGGWPEQLTFDGQSIAQVEYSPDGRWIAFLQDQGGNECYQLCLLPVSGGEKRVLTAHPDRRHLGFCWSSNGKSLFYCSNRRNPKYFHVYRHDLAEGHETEVFKNDLEGDAGIVAVSARDRRLFWVVGQTNLRQTLLTIDLKTGESKDLTPGPECTVGAAHWVEKEGAVYFLTNFDSNTHGIGKVAVEDSAFAWVRKPGKAELAGLAVSKNGKSLAWIENRDGYLDAYLTRKGSRRALLPAKAARGVTFGLSFSEDGKTLGLIHSSPTTPHELYTLAIKKGDWAQLTRSGATGVPPKDLVTPELLTYRSFDGLKVSGFFYRPKGKGPFPLLVWPHGGPEAQELADYRARHQFWANHGIAVFAPNFRGSTGSGTKFQRLIYKDWGGGHYRDVVAGVKALIRRGWADSERVAVYGGSFGGYTALWAITQDPDLWKAAVAAVAPSNLKTLIESTHASWRRWAEELIGNPEDSDELARRSPLTYADRVRTPLLLFQGANDPRVPKAEAEQFVEALRRHAIPCDYVVFENEGHGWRTLERVFEEMERSLAFVGRHLKGDGAPEAAPEEAVPAAAIAA